MHDDTVGPEDADLQAARALLEGNPTFEAGATVEIRELPRTSRARSEVRFAGARWRFVYSMWVRGCSSAGRALRSQCRGRGFEPPHLHHPPVRRSATPRGSRSPARPPPGPLRLARCEYDARRMHGPHRPTTVSPDEALVSAALSRATLALGDLQQRPLSRFLVVGSIVTAVDFTIFNLFLLFNAEPSRVTCCWRTRAASPSPRTSGTSSTRGSRSRSAATGARSGRTSWSRWWASRFTTPRCSGSSSVVALEPSARPERREGGRRDRRRHLELPGLSHCSRSACHPRAARLTLRRGDRARRPSTAADELGRAASVHARVDSSSAPANRAAPRHRAPEDLWLGLDGLLDRGMTNTGGWSAQAEASYAPTGSRRRPPRVRRLHVHRADPRDRRHQRRLGVHPLRRDPAARWALRDPPGCELEPPVPSAVGRPLRSALRTVLGVYRLSIVVLWFLSAVRLLRPAPAAHPRPSAERPRHRRVRLQPARLLARVHVHD